MTRSCASGFSVRPARVAASVVGESTTRNSDAIAAVISSSIAKLSLLSVVYVFDQSCLPSGLLNCICSRTRLLPGVSFPVNNRRTPSSRAISFGLVALPLNRNVERSPATSSAGHFLERARDTLQSCRQRGIPSSSRRRGSRLAARRGSSPRRPTVRERENPAPRTAVREHVRDDVSRPRGRPGRDRDLFDPEAPLPQHRVRAGHSDGVAAGHHRSTPPTDDCDVSSALRKREAGKGRHPGVERTS